MFGLLPMLTMAFWLGVSPTTFLKDIDPAVTSAIASFKEKYAAGPATDKPKLFMVGGQRPASAAGNGEVEPPPAGAGGNP